MRPCVNGPVTSKNLDFFLLINNTVAMSTNPQAFFRFAGQHYGLLQDLFYREGGVNDADLFELILRKFVSIRG